MKENEMWGSSCLSGNQKFGKRKVHAVVYVSVEWDVMRYGTFTSEHHLKSVINKLDLMGNRKNYRFGNRSLYRVYYHHMVHSFIHSPFFPRLNQ